MVELTVQGEVEVRAGPVARSLIGSPKDCRAYPRNQQHDQRQQMRAEYDQEIYGRVLHDRSQDARPTIL